MIKRRVVLESAERVVSERRGPAKPYREDVPARDRMPDRVTVDEVRLVFYDANRDRHRNAYPLLVSPEEAEGYQVARYNAQDQGSPVYELTIGPAAS